MSQRKEMRDVTRRDFLRGVGATAVAGASPMILTGCASLGTGAVRPRLAPNSRVNMGFVGVGNRGLNLLDDFLGDERVQVVALCDVNAKSAGYWDNKVGGREEGKRVVEEKYAKEIGAGTYKGVDLYTDYRELLERKDIDAVVMATPDHWHAMIVTAAANAGKDIYGEKPLCLTIHEGRIMADTVAKNQRIFQTGSQQRSDEKFRHACELVRNGYIGQLKSVKCGLPSGTPDISKQGSRTAPEPVPAGFDYNTWLGPAPEAPYRPAASHVNWRWVFDYSGGQLTDWSGHHPDIAQWGMGTTHTGPVEIRNPKAEYAQGPVYNTATNYSYDCVYANGVVLSVGSALKGGVTFEGDKGWVWVNRGKIEASDPKLLDVKIGENEIHLYKSDHHQRNFIDCVFSREETIAPIEQGHRSVTIAHLGNIAMRLGRNLKWNPEREEFIGDKDANEYLHRPYRGPWKLAGLPKGGKSLSPASPATPGAAPVADAESMLEHVNG